MGETTSFWDNKSTINSNLKLNGRYAVGIDLAGDYYPSASKACLNTCFNGGSNGWVEHYSSGRDKVEVKPELFRAKRKFRKVTIK